MPYLNAKLILNDPSHQREVRKLKAEMMLNDIMSRDEILASYSPLEVANAYEDLAASAPALVNNRVLLQTNLKRMLHGNLMPSDAKDIVDSNKEVSTGSLNLSPLALKSEELANRSSDAEGNN